MGERKWNFGERGCDQQALDWDLDDDVQLYGLLQAEHVLLVEES